MLEQLAIKAALVMTAGAMLPNALYLAHRLSPLSPATTKIISDAAWLTGLMWLASKLGG